MFASAVLIDIKSIFNRIDRMVKYEGKSAEALVMQYCKEAVDLHARVYRHVSFLFWILLVFFP